jgi:outer membrane protein OmpA-like peptidoglycan-associated protein/capsule polysaccharide export protein KpsE/RkpR
LADSVATSRLALAIGVVAALLVASGVWIWSLDQRLSTAEQTREELRAGLTGAVGDVAALAGKQQTFETTLAALPRDEDVQAEVAAIRSQVATVEERLEAFPGADLDAFSSRLDGVEAQLAQLDVPDVAPLRDALASVRRDVQQVQNQVGEITPERVEQLSGRVDALGQQLASLEMPDIAPVVDDLEQLDERLGTVETGLADSRFSSRLDSVEAQLAQLDVPDLGPLRDALASVQQNMQQVQTQVEGITPERLEDLSGRVDTLTRQLASLEIPDISAVVDEFEQLDGRLRTVETSLAGSRVSSRLESVEAQLAQLDVPDLGPLQDALASVRRDVQQVQTQLEAPAPGRLEELSGRVDALTQQVASLEIPDLSPVVDDLEQLVGRLDTVETDVARVVSTGPESLQGRIDALAAQLAAISVPDLGPIEERLAAVATDVDTLKPAVAAAASQDEVGAVREETATLNVQIDELAQRLASARTQTETLTAQVGELSAALASKAERAEAASLAEQLDALRQQVAALPVGDAARLEDEVTALREALAALEARLASLPPAGDIASLRSDLEAISQGPRQSPASELVERIHFGVNEAGVAPEEQPKIDAVARMLRESPATLQLFGFSDSQGPAELNRTLSLRRAAAVRAALISAGVDPATVTSVVGLGEDGPPVDLGDEIEEARNRVVMIYRRP